MPNLLPSRFLTFFLHGLSNYTEHLSSLSPRYYRYYRQSLLLIHGVTMTYAPLATETRTDPDQIKMSPRETDSEVLLRCPPGEVHHLDLPTLGGGFGGWREGMKGRRKNALPAGTSNLTTQLWRSRLTHLGHPSLNLRYPGLTISTGEIRTRGYSVVPRLPRGTDPRLFGRLGEELRCAKLGL